MQSSASRSRDSIGGLLVHDCDCRAACEECLARIQGKDGDWGLAIGKVALEVGYKVRSLSDLGGKNADDVGSNWAKVQQGKKTKYNQGCIYVDVGDSRPRGQIYPHKKDRGFSGIGR